MAPPPFVKSDFDFRFEEGRFGEAECLCWSRDSLSSCWDSADGFIGGCEVVGFGAEVAVAVVDIVLCFVIFE